MKIDEAIFRSFAKLRGRSKVLDRLVVFVARQLVIVMALAALLTFYLKIDAAGRWSFISLTILSVVIAWPLAVLLELFFGRRRPYRALHKKPLEEFWTPTPSFPSSHAAIAFAIATPVFLFDPLIGAAFFISAALVALARVYVGVHYASDVIAGAILGTAVSWLIASL